MFRSISAISGETMFNGKDIVELCGHYNDDFKPEGFDTKQIFVSPSICYAGNDAYAPVKLFVYNILFI